MSSGFDPADAVGIQLKADLRVMYKAGHFDFPEEAARVSQHASAISQLVGKVDSFAAQAGDPSILRDALSTMDDVSQAMRKMTRTLNDCAVGILHIADDFVARDQDAQIAFSQLSKALREAPAPTPVPLPVLTDHSVPGSADHASAPTPMSPEEDQQIRHAHGDAQLGQAQIPEIHR